VQHQDRLEGLGGWLVLVGFGLIVAPIRMVIDLVRTYLPLFQEDAFAQLTTPGSQFYNPPLAQFILAESIYNVISIAVLGYLICLFFRKHRRFPRLYVWYILISLAFTLSDAWYAARTFPNENVPDDETVADFSRTLLTALIWVPYMLRSQRVRATFVRGRSFDPVVDMPEVL
jgi:hypothetical protein